MAGWEGPIEVCARGNASQLDDPAELLIASIFHGDIQHGADMTAVGCRKSSFYQAGMLNGGRVNYTPPSPPFARGVQKSATHQPHALPRAFSPAPKPSQRP